jgi:glucose/arabinose dehydrogenase
MCETVTPHPGSSCRLSPPSPPGRGFALVVIGVLLALPAHAETLTGAAAFGDVSSDRPGVMRKITADDLPKPGVQVGAASSRRVQRPGDLKPLVPDGYEASLVARGLDNPRRLRVAPNGDLFVAETSDGRILLIRGTEKPQVFATGLAGAFGMAFWPTDNPRYLYVATTREVFRIPYANGDVKARGKPERVVSGMASGGHSTRDIAFSPDGKTLFVSVGSEGNRAEDIVAKPRNMAAFERTHGLGAAWGSEQWRATVLAFDADGKNRRAYANGLRNCAGLTLQKQTGALWCAVNERDMLGDDLPPDYVTSLKAGGFYGWPWFYIGKNEDPAHRGARPDLADKIVVPDVLIQAHSAPLDITFGPDGSGFVALHGSWNRTKVTGYKVVRLPMKDGKATGEYEDFVTGFMAPGGVWGRPVAVEFAKDGALLVAEDASGTIWRIAKK